MPCADPTGLLLANFSAAATASGLYLPVHVVSGIGVKRRVVFSPLVVLMRGGVMA